MNPQPHFFWLASFPRSGNTFVRNILYNVFGLESSTFENDQGVLLEDDYLRYPVIKTHRLPSELLPADPGIKAVYLVRDGRDAMVSMAHHRSDIVAPGSDFMENMRAAVFAEKGSFFGGWSQNVLQWIPRADLIIRYEDLITDPATCVERIRLLVGLPEGDYRKIPGFEALKFGIPKYGAGRDRAMTGEEKRALAERNFRKGKAGSWKEEMPDDLHDLFWSIHGEAMLKMGYSYDGTLMAQPDQDLDWDLLVRTRGAVSQQQPPVERFRVLIEAEKIASPANDGVKRYELTLLKELLHVHLNPEGRWWFDLLVHGEYAPITSYAELITEPFTGARSVQEKQAVQLHVPLSVWIQQKMLALIPSGVKQWLEDHRITIFHRAFDLWWSILHSGVYQSKRIFRFLIRAVQRVGATLSGKDPNVSGDKLLGYDLIHIPLQHHYKPFLRSRAPVLVTIHDFTHRIFPRFHTPQNIRNAERGWRFVQRRASEVIAVSHATGTDAVRFSDRALRPPVVIHEAIDRWRFSYRVNTDDRRSACRRYGIPDGVPFFLTLSSIEPRKNLETVIQAFFELLSEDCNANLMLVVAGKQQWGRFHPQTLAGFNPAKVMFTGFVDDEDLPHLYSEALAFCYVSHYEGFGLPLLEALNCGTPVIYGNNSAMPEVVGEAGLPADASDFRDIARQMRRLFYDEALRHNLSLLARKQAAGFSPRLMAKQTLNTYEKCMRYARKT
jgi:glycosyltransferase involved in cell wall biosynthesis